MLIVFLKVATLHASMALFDPGLVAAEEFASDSEDVEFEQSSLEDPGLVAGESLLEDGPDAPVHDDECDALVGSTASVQSQIVLAELSSGHDKRAKLAAEVKVLKQTVRRQAAKLEALKHQQLVAAQANSNPLVCIDTSKRYQSLSVVTDTACRRNCGISSLRSAAIWTRCGVNPTTIRKWEIKTHTSLLAGARDFHVEHEYRMRHGDHKWAVAGFNYKSDATNTIANKFTSYQTMVVRACYNFGGTYTAYKKIWPDTQAIVDHSGHGCLQLLRKQWRSVKFPVEQALVMPLDDCDAYRWITARTDGGPAFC